VFWRYWGLVSTVTQFIIKNNSFLFLNFVDLLTTYLTCRSPLFMIVRFVLDADEVNRKGQRTVRQWRAYVSAVWRHQASRHLQAVDLDLKSSLTSDFRNSTFHHIYIEMGEWQKEGESMGWRKSGRVPGISIYGIVNFTAVLRRHKDKHIPSKIGSTEISSYLFFVTK
jgi:hypothetical protein